MKIKAVLFDLDGTLLPMDQEKFTYGYFTLLSQKLATHGYDPKQLVSSIWTGVTAMVQNTGTQTNEEAFLAKFREIYGEKAISDKYLFDEYYENEFQTVQPLCGFTPAAAKVVHYLKEKGVRVALATNPIFPAVATKSRIAWAGLKPEDFELYTTYENSCYCKPNPDYYRAILKQMDVNPEECLMVGNDVTEDMVAGNLGMQVFLLTDCLINKENKDITVYPKGDFSDLMQFLDALLAQ